MHSVSAEDSWFNYPKDETSKSLPKEDTDSYLCRMTHVLFSLNSSICTIEGFHRKITIF